MSLCALLAIAIASACGGAGESKSGALAAFGPTLTSASGAHYLKHEIIILRDPSSSDKDYQNALAHLHAGNVDDQNEITEQLGYIRVELAKEISVDDAISYLHRQNVVLEAERNYLVKHSAIPNDTLYPELWNMERIGMPTAWDLTTGSADVVVAISDTGIDLEHPELSKNIWVNPDEIPGNKIDDDKNGYIDDHSGWNWRTGFATASDDHGHGTHVAGIIGARGDNAEGVAGINWSVQIMPLKFLTDTGYGTLWDASLSVLYAAEKKAHVFNASWGCAGCDGSYLHKSIEVLHTAGGLFVTAAGNSSDDLAVEPFYPAGYDLPNVVSVAATDSTDGLAWFSNYGTSIVHLAAPGDGIMSTVRWSKYDTFSGSSMAAAHVSGLAALYLSKTPNVPPDKLKTLLIHTSTPMTSLSDRVVSNGLVHAPSFIAASAIPPDPPEDFDLQAGVMNDFALQWTPNEELELGYYRIRWGLTSGEYSEEAHVAWDQNSITLFDFTSETTYFFVIHAIDKNGLESDPSEEISGEAIDSTAPAQVVDLSAEPVNAPLLTLNLVGSSGQYSPFWGAEKSVDGVENTAWMSPPRTTNQEEFLTVGFSDTNLIDRVELLPNPLYPQFFPKSFDVEVSVDGIEWNIVAGMRSASLDKGQWAKLSFLPTLASFIRLRILEGHLQDSGAYISSIAEVRTREISTDYSQLRLTFTAPGDDPGRGAATSYEVRYGSEPLNADTFITGTTVPAAVPQESGYQEVVIAQDLIAERPYFFTLTATDEAGNVSELSNTAQGSTIMIPPAIITDLLVLDTTATGVTLQWTAPGGNGHLGQAATYEMRYDLVPFNSASFAQAQVISGLPDPGLSGTLDQFTLTGLDLNTDYYFAIRTYDSSGAASGISDVVLAHTQDKADILPPATIDTLEAFPSLAETKGSPTLTGWSSEFSSGYGAQNLIDGNPDTVWSSAFGAIETPEWASFDLGSIEAVSQFRLLPSTTAWFLDNHPYGLQIQGSVDGDQWTTLVDVSGLTPVASTWDIYPIPGVSLRYLRLYITERRPQFCTNPGGCEAGGYVELSEFEIYTHNTQYDVGLSWIAPGDDGWDGKAALYDVRRDGSSMDETTFPLATVVQSNAPQSAGSVELIFANNLPLETTVFFAVIAEDDQGNRGGLSNIVQADTPGLPPAPVSDLSASGATAAQIDLQWTATGDDGLVGTATSYSLRYNTAPIDPDNFESLPAATGLPLPAPSGGVEVFSVSGLSSNTLYYFALKVSDELGNTSIMSNVLTQETADALPPSTITDLSVAAHNPNGTGPLALLLTDSSGSTAVETEAQNLFDGSTDTFWITGGGPNSSVEYAEMQLPIPVPIGRIRLRSPGEYAPIFPKNFEVQIKEDPSGIWTTIIHEEDFETDGDWEEWTVGSVPSTDLRVVVHEMWSWAEIYHSAISEIEVYADPIDFTSMELSWTAPGDDGNEGTAASYDLRTASLPVDDTNFGDAAIVTGPPDPHIAGTLELMKVSDLTPDTAYCFAIKASDESGNISPTSNTACAFTNGIPPATVSDLIVTNITAGTVTLSWTAPGDDGAIGQAASYEIRYGTDRLNTETWESSMVALSPPSPGMPASTETHIVTGLTGATTYYFALRTTDATTNQSPISNNAKATTLDNVPPSQVIDLYAWTNTDETGSLFVSWTAPGNNGAIGQASFYDLRVNFVPITEENFEASFKQAVADPKLPGETETFVLHGLLPEMLYYVAVRTVDDAENSAALSNIASAETRAEPPAQVSDLAVIGSSATPEGDSTLTLQWTTPGDDQWIGTVVSYDFRISTSPINAVSFETSPALNPTPVIQPGGTVSEHTVESLIPGQTYFFAFKATDDWGNASLISNVATAQAPDAVLPGDIFDLNATTGATNGTMTLNWTAPGDDGSVGTLDLYDLRYSLAPIDDANFDAATPMAPSPTPILGGQAQVHLAQGLPPEELVYFAMKAKDDSNNWSGLSNVASARTKDQPPNAVLDLSQAGQSDTSVTLSFKAPGDNAAVGTASAYHIRYSLLPITEANFPFATLVAGMPAPLPAGNIETITIPGLTINSAYYFALTAEDDRANVSEISNVVFAHTTDTLAPAEITDLVASTGTQPGAITLAWTSVGDNGLVGNADSYDIRYSTSPIDDTNWDLATKPPVLPVPQPAGLGESFNVFGLQGETLYYFTIRAIDEASNMGTLSLNANAETLPIAPAKISDLVVIGQPTNTNMTLKWTAVGDNGAGDGAATSYDIRYHTEEITLDNLNSCTIVTAPTPGEPGALEVLDLSGFDESTTYYFVVRATDDLGTSGPLSNVAVYTTPDLTPPAQPGSLTVLPGTVESTLVPIYDVNTDSELSGTWFAENLKDGSVYTSWASTGSAEATEVKLTLNLGESVAIERIRMLPDTTYTNLFPRGFDIQVSADNIEWDTVATENNFHTSNATWVTWGFPSIQAQYLRIRIYDANTSYFFYYSIIAEIEVYEATATEGSMTLSWVAPGDDAHNGTASVYEVYNSLAPFSEGSLGTATLVPDAPEPKIAGSIETMNVPGLAGETLYYWAVRAIDDENQVGALSLTKSGYSNPIPPAPIEDLSADTVTMTSVDLIWTAPGDDGNTGTANAYEMRYAPWSITSQNFHLATPVAGVPSPSEAGSTESASITGLIPSTNYRVALRAKDEVGNLGFLSNIANFITGEGPDSTPPARVINLDARVPTSEGFPQFGTITEFSSQQDPGFTIEMVVDGNMNTFWSTEALIDDNGASFQMQLLDSVLMDHVRIWPAAGYEDLFPISFDVRISPNGLSWTTVYSEIGYLATPGVPAEAVFPAVEGQFIELVATELPLFTNGFFYATVAEFEIFEQDYAPGSVIVTWNAPGDDAYVGQADQYDLRYGNCPINWGSATQVASTIPLPSGSPERVTVSGLSTGTYCFGLRTADEMGLWSEISNPAPVVVP